MNAITSSQQLAQQFHRDGYLAIDNFFPADMMDRYQELILAHFADAPAYIHNPEFLSKAATEVIPWFPQQEGIDAFSQAEQDDKLRALTEAILGDGWYALYCMTMFSPQGSLGQAWHQDSSPCDPSRFNVNRLIYTEDVTSTIGGQTIVVPGSHKRGELTVGPVDEDMEDQLVLTPRKGTLIMLHGHTWHRVLPVRGRYRVSTNYRCCPRGTPENITDICVYRNMRYRFETSEIVEDRLQG